jgi:5,10-methenyltetrahydromethanopterin hydrogenase
MYEYTGQAYHEAAKGAWTQFERAGSLFGDVLDSCVAVGAAIGAGIATSSTIIGAIGGSAAAGWYAWRAWKAYQSATEILDETQKMLERFVNSVTIIEDGGKQLIKEPPSVLPFPTTPYQFPGA